MRRMPKIPALLALGTLTLIVGLSFSGIKQALATHSSWDILKNASNNLDFKWNESATSQLNLSTAGEATFANGARRIFLGTGDGAIELIDPTDSGTYIDFKNVTGEDFDQRIGSNSTNNTLEFYTAGVNRMNLNSSGQLKLIADNTGGSDRASQFFIEGKTNPNLRLNLGIHTEASPPYADIGFVEDSVAWRNIVLAKTAGNVGIGTANPAAKLDVNGNIAVSGTTLINIVAGGFCMNGRNVTYDPQPGDTFGGASVSNCNNNYDSGKATVNCPAGTTKHVLFAMTNAGHGGEGVICTK